MKQRKKPFFTLFERSDLIILVSYVLLASLLIVKVFMDDWNKLSLLFILASLVFSWYLHFSQVLKQDYRILIYAFCILGSFIYYGLHASSLFNMAPVIILIMLVLSLSGKRALVYFSLFIYLSVLFLDFFVFFRDQYVADQALVERLLFHVLLVTFSALMAGLFVFRIKEERIRVETYVDSMGVAETRANETIKNVSLEMSHPADAISGETMLLQKEALSDNARQEIFSLHVQGEKLRSQIADLGDFIEIVNQTVEIKDSVYSVFEIMDALRMESRARLALADVDPVVDLDPLLPQSLIGDGEKIKKILKQLVSNAFRYTKQGCVQIRVYMITHGTAANLCIEVNDTGIGMEQSYLERIKTRLSQLSVCDYRPGGMGIGLNIVYGYARALGGFVNIRSSFGLGTSVRVSIPSKVANAVPVALYSKKSNVAAGWILQEENISKRRLRRYIMEMLERITRNTGAPMYQVRSEEDLTSLKKAFRVVCLFIPRELYEEKKEYYDALGPQVFPVTVEYRLKHSADEGSSNEDGPMTIRQPFSSVHILRCMEAADAFSRTKRQEDREALKIPSAGDLPLPRPCKVHLEKKDVLLVSDSFCDLPPELLWERDIRILPIRIFAGDRAFYDRKEIGQDGVIRYFNEGGTITTEQPRVDDVRLFLQKCLKDAKTVIFLTAAKEVGTVYDKTCEALKKEFPDVYFLDSGQASGGLGLMLLEADAMVREGRDASEITAALLRMRNYVSTSFIVDSTDYLERAKLLRRSIHSLSTSLMLHPVLSVKNRRIHLERIYVGSKKTVQKKYLRKLLSHREQIDPERVILCYVGMSFEELEEVRRQLYETGYFKEIMIVKGSAVVTASTGPGTFGIMYRRKEGRI